MPSGVSLVLRGKTNKIEQWELFDLEKDPHQLKNLSTDSAQADTIQKLKDEDDQFENELPKADV